MPPDNKLLCLVPAVPKCRRRTECPPGDHRQTGERRQPGPGLLPLSREDVQLARPGWKCLSFVGLKFIRLSAWPLFIHKEIRNDEACQGEERPGPWREAVLGDANGPRRRH